MDEQEQQAIHEAVDAALQELASHLGGTSDTGGPVENATQVKGRADLGVLLTDAQDRVLGRVWIAFGAGVEAPSGPTFLDGGVEVHAEVCSEVVDPPQGLEEWVEGR